MSFFIFLSHLFWYPVKNVLTQANVGKGFLPNLKYCFYQILDVAWFYQLVPAVLAQCPSDLKSFSMAIFSPNLFGLFNLRTINHPGQVQKKT